MKFSQTALPRRFARSIVPPPSCETTRGGAVSPTWNPACEASLADAEPPGPADPDGPPEPTAPDPDGARLTLGDPAAMRLGSVEGGGVGRSPMGSGPAKTSAARTPNATSTPARRPATIVTPDL